MSSVRVFARNQVPATLVAAAFAAAAVAGSGCSGQALPLAQGLKLGSAVIEGTGEERADGNSLGRIYSVTQVVEAPYDFIPGWDSSTNLATTASTADYPFIGRVFRAGHLPVSDVVDAQSAFYFSYQYPSNNYKLATARLVIDTQRDSSDTEGIFVDGVFSGNPPAGRQRTTSPKVTHAIYNGSGFATPNIYFNDWSINHYKRLTRNTFELDLVELLRGTTVTPGDVVRDGFVPVVTGDDSPVYQAYLVMQGYTISKNELSCAPSPNYTFQNVFLHYDGRPTGSSAAFDGTVESPSVSWTTARASDQSVEFWFEPALPRVDLANVSLTTGTLRLRVKRAATGSAALVVNGVGVAEASFVRSTASAGVESWISDAQAISAWEAAVAAIPATEADTTVTIDLRAIYGESQLESLLAQGKLHVTIAGSLAIAYGQAATSTRAAGTAVDGPELNLAGTYFNTICQVPDDPTSPLVDGGDLPTCLPDDRSPAISSVQVSEITATSAVVQWLSDEGGTSQVSYGISGGASALSSEDSTLSTFHQVQLTGLSPYKYYSVQARSADCNGNLSVSAAKTFRTLR